MSLPLVRLLLDPKTMFRQRWRDGAPGRPRGPRESRRLCDAQSTRQLLRLVSVRLRCTDLFGININANKPLTQFACAPAFVEAVDT